MADGIIRLDEGWHLDAGQHLDQPPILPPVVPLPVRPKRPKGLTHMDYLPKTRAELKNWWLNLKTQGQTELAKINLPLQEITDMVDLATDQYNKMQATDDLESALKAARLIEKAATAQNEPVMRLGVRNWKTRPLYATSGIEGTLGLKGTEEDFDPLTFKTELKLSIVGGQIRVDFLKSKCDSIAIYCRLRGTATWIKLGTDTRSPYYDTNPLANPAIPEVREYMGMGVIDNEEVGVPSDIVSIVFGG